MLRDALIPCPVGTLEEETTGGRACFLQSLSFLLCHLWCLQRSRMLLLPLSLSASVAQACRLQSSVKADPESASQINDRQTHCQIRSPALVWLSGYLCSGRPREEHTPQEITTY